MIKLEQVVPWGRSLDEYRRMFALGQGDLHRRIVGVADGPASFNAELTKAQGKVVSYDPLYRFSTDEIRQRIDLATPQIIDQAQRQHDRFMWSPEIPCLDALIRCRHHAMHRFLDDFDTGKREGRYVDANLPDLVDVPSDAFDIAVCSHFLFLYSDHFSKAFHIQAVRRLVEIAADVRIFPLTDLENQLSPHVAPVVASARRDGHLASVQQVDYEFQRGSNRMMRIVR